MSIFINYPEIFSVRSYFNEFCIDHLNFIVFSLAFIICFMNEHNILEAILAGGRSKRKVKK